MRFGAQAAFAAALVLVSAAGAAAAGLPRPANEVFQFQASRTDAGGVKLHWSIAPGTYLYRSSISVERDGSALKLALPPGEAKDDPFVGKTEIYRSALEVTLPRDEVAGASSLRVAYQGCAENVFCYAPLSRTLDLGDLAAGGHGETP